MTRRIKCGVEEKPDKGLAVLRVESVTLVMDDRQDFRRAARVLANSEMPRLVVDFSGLSRIMSVFIGETVYLAEQARSRGKKLAVLAPRHVAEMFELTGTSNVFSLHVIGEKRPKAKPG